jgi:hypothetical protein
MFDITRIIPPDYLFQVTVKVFMVWYDKVRFSTSQALGSPEATKMTAVYIAVGLQVRKLRVI